ncbi:MAG: mechanosensitive ion channel family protein [Pseudoruegeria sp.]
MTFTTLFDPYIQDHPVLAIVVVLILALWLFGKRTAVLRRAVASHPVAPAVVDLFAAPLLVLHLGSLLRQITVQVGGFDVSRQIIEMTLLSLLISLAWRFARLAELFFLSLRNQDDAAYLPGLQRGLLFGGFLFLGIVSFLYIQGYSITGLYISTGAVAALVAFAMQRTLGDLFSGIALSIEHPFKLGEIIRLADGSEGKVVDINWRATRLLGWDNSTLVVPNSELAQQGFINFHGSDHIYAPWYEVKIPAEVDPRLAKALLLEAALRCDKILKHPLPLVRLLDATTVPYTYMVWVHYPNYHAMFSGREQLFDAIHYALKDVGAQVSPSIHELHTRRAGTTAVDPPTTLLALKMLDIAKSLSEEELEHLAEMSNRITFEAGTIIVAEGAIARSVDIISHGVVETSIRMPTGAQKIVDQLRSGQYFGLTSMLMDNPAFLQFKASTNVTLIRIDIDCLRLILANRTDLHAEFAGIMKQRMDAAHNVRLSSDQIEKRFTFQDFLRRLEKFAH